MEEKKTLKHNYTSELELKSLLIRIKNERADMEFNDSHNRRLNKYIKWHTDINNKKYAQPMRRNITKKKLKDLIIAKSEVTAINQESYERFGEIILLMIKNILKKPQFSGYTYKDDFYSDAVYKILKYLGNFNHKLISERTGQPVNAFAYISQIIHNSILFILNQKKKELENHKKQVEIAALQQNMNLQFNDWYAEDKDIQLFEEPIQKKETVIIKDIKTTLYDELIKLTDDIDSCTSMEIIYPKKYQITFDEFNDLKPLLKGKVSITRAKGKNND